MREQNSTLLSFQDASPWDQETKLYPAHSSIIIPKLLCVLLHLGVNDFDMVITGDISAWLYQQHLGASQEVQ